MDDGQIRARDAGLRRISSLTGWIAAACVSVVGVIAVALAIGQHQPAASSAANPAATAPAGGSQVGSGSETQPGGLQPPASAPLPGVGGTGGPVSGGS